MLKELRQLSDSEQGDTFKVRCVNSKYAQGSPLQRTIYTRCQQHRGSLVIKSANRFQYLCPSFFEKSPNWPSGDSVYCPVVRNNQYYQDPLRPQIFPTTTQPGLMLQVVIFELLQKSDISTDLISAMNFVACRSQTQSLEFPFNYYFFLLRKQYTNPLSPSQGSLLAMTCLLFPLQWCSSGASQIQTPLILLSMYPGYWMQSAARTI